jgi:flavorubredoxin
MKKVLVAYFSSSGKTEEMANYIAEGVRFNGLQAKVMSMSEIKNGADIDGFDGYLLGSPTFSLDIPAPVKSFLALMNKLNLAEKLGGAFGPYLHDASYQHADHAPSLILEELQKEIKLKPFDLGALALKEDILGTREGIKACQDYGRVFAQRLA